MSTIFALLLLFLFYRWIYNYIFGKNNQQGFFQGGTKQLLQILAWIAKNIWRLVKGLFRIFIYNPRR